MKLSKKILKKDFIATLYVGLNVAINLIVNKIIFLFMGASGFSTFSLFKNYINFGLNTSTLNGQNPTIYFFSKLNKIKRKNLFTRYIIFVLLVSSIITILLILFNPVKSYNQLFFLILPILAFFQVNRFYRVFQKKYISIIKVVSFYLSILIILFFLDILEFETLAVLSLFSSVITIPFLFNEPQLFSLNKSWSNFFNFLKVCLKTWLPNILSALSLLGIRQVYNNITIDSEIAGIYDISQGLNVMIFSLLLSSLNLIILPKFMSGKASIKSVYFNYLPIILIFYLTIILFANELLYIAFGALSSEYVFFFRILIIIDFLRVSNVIDGLYLFSNDIILFPSLVDGIFWFFIFISVIVFSKHTIYIFPISVFVSAILIKVLYWTKILKI